jgi:Skp family chaperone for outer membrane proteins
MRGWCACILCLIVALLPAAIAGFANAGDERPAPRIATINIAKVFANYKKTQDLDRDLRATRDQKQQVADEKRNEITKLRDSIALLEIGTEPRKKQEEEFQRKQVEFQTFQKVTADSLLSTRKEATEKLYAEIIKAIGDYSREQKLDLIVKVDDAPLTSATIDELLFKINQRNIVYSSPQLDITDAVLNRLNKGYAKEVIEK